MIHIPHILYRYIPYTPDIYTVFVSRLFLEILIKPRDPVASKPQFRLRKTHLGSHRALKKSIFHRTRGRSFKTTYPIPFPIFFSPPIPLFLLFPPPRSRFPTKHQTSPKPCVAAQERGQDPPSSPSTQVSPPTEAGRGWRGGTGGGSGTGGPRRCPALHGNPTCGAGKGKAAKVALKTSPSARRASLEAVCPPAVPAEKMHYYFY